MAKYRQTVEPGIYRRIHPRTGQILPRLWVHYQRGRETIHEPVQTTRITEARKLRARRMTEAARGDPGRSSERLTVEQLLAGVVRTYELNAKASLRTVRSHVAAWNAAGWATRRAINITTESVEAQQQRWREAGTTNTTINRRCETLRRAFNLALRARLIPHVPHIPRLDPGVTQRGQYLPPGETVLLAEHLPTYVVELLTFAREYGIRRGQLSKTRRRYVDLERALILWPPHECKAREPHLLPLIDPGLGQVRRLMAAARPWCPYLFHGPRCAPGRHPHRQYGCVGDFKKAWRTACERAGLPVGRRAGGFTFRDTRNTAATELRAQGLEEADAMKITGHRTTYVFRHYDLGDVEALRARLELARRQLVPRARRPHTVP